MRFLPVYFLLIFSCQNRKLISDEINKHEPINISKFVLSEELGEEYSVHFEKQKIKPLKKEWKTLYDYARKGHILKSNKDDELLIFSYEFYNYYTVQQMRTYYTQFMNKHDNIIAIFGEPSLTLTNSKKIIIAYSPWYPDNTCTTCPHPPGFDFEFDLETKLRIVPDWIQEKIDEDKD